MAKLTWTGTKASAEKLQDDINDRDGLGAGNRRRYATVEIEDELSMQPGVKNRRYAFIDTLSNAFTIVPGDSIEKVDGLWVKLDNSTCIRCGGEAFHHTTECAWEGKTDA